MQVLVKAQLRRILDGDDSLVWRYLGREGVEQRRLARARAAGHRHVLAQAHRPAQKPCVPQWQRPQPHQALERTELAGELPDGDDGPVHRNGRDDGVHAIAVRQARVHDGARIIQAAAQGRQDAVDREHDLLGRVEDAPGRLQLARPLEVQRPAAVHHDLGDGVVVKQGLQGPQAHDLVDDLLDELGPVLPHHLRQVARVEDGLAGNGQLLAGAAHVLPAHEVGDLVHTKPVHQRRLERRAGLGGDDDGRHLGRSLLKAGLRLLHPLENAHG